MIKDKYGNKGSGGGDLPPGSGEGVCIFIRMVISSLNSELISVDLVSTMAPLINVW
ncbi:hypothetical protein HBDW_41140 [Herbaspirillum sp. DW155]|uniref:hypothetical protein n=1 Tax=Herbaspirillum sp. DW155 TaxID=3095609 RepID=UPI0030925E8A|nr:hypothetical protein HBDW_41140 [Herbaspirillum sp. DW155]